MGICAARTDSGISKIQDIMGGKELVVSSFGKGTLSYDPPAVMKAMLGMDKLDIKLLEKAYRDR